MTVRMSLLAAAAFLSARFCLSVLPAFLLLDWRGDLSATAAPRVRVAMRHARLRACWRVPSRAFTGPVLTVLGLQTPRNGFESIRGDPHS